MDIKTKFELGDKVYVVEHDYSISLVEISSITVNRKTDGTYWIEYFFIAKREDESQTCGTFEEARKLAKEKALKKYENTVSFIESQKEPA